MRYKDFAGTELLENEFIAPKHDPNKDYRKAEHSDTRKPRLTLKEINKLKKIRAVHQLEKVKKAKIVTTMYGLSGDDDGSSF